MRISQESVVLWKCKIGTDHDFFSQSKAGHTSLPCIDDGVQSNYNYLN